MRIGDYLQEYGPIQRRRRSDTGPLDDEQAPEGRPPISDEDPEPPRRARERVRRRRHLKRRPSLVRVALVTMLVLMLALIALPYGLSLFYRGQVLPGVTLQGLPVAGMDEQELNELFQLRYDDFLQQPLEVSYGSQTWQPAAEDLGIELTLDQTIAEALATGRQGDPFSRLGQLWTQWQQGVDIAPTLTVDRRQLQRYLVEVANEVNYPAVDARLNIARSSVLSTPGIPGLQVLVDASANDVLRALSTLEPHTVTLRTRLLEPVVSDEAALAAETQARDMMSSPLVLRHNNEQWVWENEKLASLLQVERVGNRLDVRIDHERLTNEVASLGVAIDTGSVEPRLRFDGSNLQIIREGQVGARLEQQPALEVISDTLQLSQQMTRTVTLPVEELRPVVEPETLSELGIRELVGEGKSSFAGSAPYRITNIKAGAVRMDGVLIAPDEEFSFNTQLGEVNADNGFVEGYAVVGNRTTLEWGGGVCQDSTTVFRAAFWAGLPITERHAHPFYISWYDQFGLGPYGDGAGLDAAIFTGQDDLKFINDTGNWLLMQANVDEINQVLTVQLYGTRPNNRTVEIDGPHVTNVVPAPATPVYIEDASKPAGYLVQSDAARNGRDIVIHRTVLENGMVLREDSFYTHFQAWPNIFVRGTGG